MIRIEAVIAQLPPGAALAVLLLPTLGLLPIKLLALWLIACGAGRTHTQAISSMRLALPALPGLRLPARHRCRGLRKPARGYIPMATRWHCAPISPCQSTIGRLGSRPRPSGGWSTRDNAKQVADAFPRT